MDYRTKLEELKFQVASVEGDCLIVMYHPPLDETQHEVILEFAETARRAIGKRVILCPEEFRVEVVNSRATVERPKHG